MSSSWPRGSGAGRATHQSTRFACRVTVTPSATQSRTSRERKRGRETHLDSMQVERHEADEDGNLEDRVDDDRARCVDRKVRDGGHADEGAERERDRLAARAEEDARADSGERARDPLLDHEVQLRVVVVVAREEERALAVRAGVLLVELVRQEEDVVDAAGEEERLERVNLSLARSLAREGRRRDERTRWRVRGRG